LSRDNAVVPFTLYLTIITVQSLLGPQRNIEWQPPSTTTIATSSLHLDSLADRQQLTDSHAAAMLRCWRAGAVAIYVEYCDWSH